MNSIALNIWSWFRQPVSGLTHLLGAFLAASGMVWMLQETGIENLTPKLMSILLFCASMTFLYLASSLYHLLPLSDRWVARLRKLDHSAIYFFIAGSYTPVCLNLLQDSKGPAVFITVWIIACLGVILKLLWMENSRWIRVGLYIALASVSVVILPDICRTLPVPALFWLFGGIGAYSIGALIYALKWPDPIPEVLGFHELWHLFVMVGCFCHFWLTKAYLIHT